MKKKIGILLGSVAGALIAVAGCSQIKLATSSTEPYQPRIVEIQKQPEIKVIPALSAEDDEDIKFEMQLPALERFYGGLQKILKSNENFKMEFEKEPLPEQEIKPDIVRINILNYYFKNKDKIKNIETEESLLERITINSTSHSGITVEEQNEICNGKIPKNKHIKYLGEIRFADCGYARKNDADKFIHNLDYAIISNSGTLLYCGNATKPLVENCEHLKESLSLPDKAYTVVKNVCKGFIEDNISFFLKWVDIAVLSNKKDIDEKTVRGYYIIPK